MLLSLHSPWSPIRISQLFMHLTTPLIHQQLKVTEYLMYINDNMHVVHKQDKYYNKLHFDVLSFSHNVTE